MFLSLRSSTFSSSDLSCSGWPWVTKLAKRLISLNESLGKKAHETQRTLTTKDIQLSISEFIAETENESFEAFLTLLCIVCNNCGQILCYVYTKNILLLGWTLFSGYNNTDRLKSSTKALTCFMISFIIFPCLPKIFIIRDACLIC